MNPRRNFILMLAALFVMGFVAPMAAHADEKDDLKESFKRRAAALMAAKDKGDIGETSDGFVAVVKAERASDADVKKLLDGENSDRKRLYQIIAKETESTPEKVGERNGARNFRNAKAGHWLRGPDGKWFQKR